MRRVLLVDDDADIREGLRVILEDAGYDVEEARNGQDALSVLRGGRPLPDVILLDQMMPIMDGTRFRAEQLADPALSGIPVIVLSADGQIDRKAGLLRVETWLQKPIDLDLLLGQLARAVASKS